MPLPHPNMDSVPFTPLSSMFINDMIDNIESLSAGVGLDYGVIRTQYVADGAITRDKLDFDAEVDGTIWYSGDEAPSALHANGSYYIDTSTGDVYKQENDSWGSPIMQVKGATGDDGTPIELRVGSTHIQWRYVGDSVWVDLLALADIKGETGEQGPKGDTGASVPAGGTQGQTLLKNSSADYDYSWVVPPSAPVTSVAGRTGAVTLTSSDVGLGSVTNDAQVKASDRDTNTSLGASDTKVPSQKAVKTYVDNKHVASGSNTQIQYNSSGNFAGSSNLTFDGNELKTKDLKVTGNVDLPAGSLTAGNIDSATYANITDTIDYRNANLLIPDKLLYFTAGDTWTFGNSQAPINGFISSSAAQILITLQLPKPAKSGVSATITSAYANGRGVGGYWNIGAFLQT